MLKPLWMGDTDKKAGTFAHCQEDNESEERRGTDFLTTFHRWNNKLVIDYEKPDLGASLLKRQEKSFPANSLHRFI